MRCSPDLFGTPPLPGEAAPDGFEIRTAGGLSAEAHRAIFPIIRVFPNGQIDLLATGFFISTNGLFVTARHVLEAPFDRRSGEQVFSIMMVHFCEQGNYLFRPILRCAMHPIADVAVGVAAPMKRTSDGAILTNKILTLSTVPVDRGSRVVTYAFPRYENVRQPDKQIFNVMPAFYDGEIVEYLPNGRDRVLLPGSCYHTSIAIHHGASGGPVFSREGSVFAINSTGFDGTNDSFVSCVGGIFDLTIDDVAMNDHPARSVPVREIACAGYILVKPPLQT